jgi:hypothetical protein
MQNVCRKTLLSRPDADGARTRAAHEEPGERLPKSEGLARLCGLCPHLVRGSTTPSGSITLRVVTKTFAGQRSDGKRVGDTTCAFCGGTLPKQRGSGRRRRFCSDSCRFAAHLLMRGRRSARTGTDFDAKACEVRFGAVSCGRRSKGAFAIGPWPGGSGATCVFLCRACSEFAETYFRSQIDTRAARWIPHERPADPPPAARRPPGPIPAQAPTSSAEPDDLAAQAERWSAAKFGKRPDLGLPSG